MTSNVSAPRNCTLHDSVNEGGTILVEGYNAPSGVRYPFNSTNETAVASYDELVQQVWPILTVTFPPANNTREAAVGNSIGSMTCIRAGNIKADSRTPAVLPAAKPVRFPGHLSGGAIAGIVIGSLLGAAIVAGAIWWVWRRHKRQQQVQMLSDGKEEKDTILGTQLDGKDVYQMDAKGKSMQLDGTERVELGHEGPRTELDGGAVHAHELAGSNPVTKQ